LYAQANPLIYTDPFGMQAVNCHQEFKNCMDYYDRRHDRCMARADAICLGVCAYLCVRRGGTRSGLPGPCRGPLCPGNVIRGTACYLGCSAVYNLACEMDLASGQKCCREALQKCLRTGQWPPWWWIGCSSSLVSGAPTTASGESAPELPVCNEQGDTP
jgi:hypothetical protein